MMFDNFMFQIEKKFLDNLVLSQRLTKPGLLYKEFVQFSLEKMCVLGTARNNSVLIQKVKSDLLFEKTFFTLIME